MARGVKESSKRARLYELIKESHEEHGISEADDEERVARTENKTRREDGET
jgi:hypothetical protein